VEVNDIEVHDGDEKPAIRDYYSDWYLLDRDFPEGTAREAVDADLVGDVLEARREYPVRSDLSLYDVSELRAERTETIRDAEEAAEMHLEEGLEEHDVPAPLEALAYVKADKRENMMEMLRAVRDHRVGKYSEIATHCTVSGSTIGNYVGDGGEISDCIVKDRDTGGYEITPLGEKALEVPWRTIVT
jgi:hypothetical protein